jgi:staphylococcal nuclease domain-containing protein 1
MEMDLYGIEHIDTNKNIRVRFVDYGNVTTLGPNKLRPLDSNLINVPPQAKECVLGFIKQISPSDEFGHDAAMMLSEMAWGQILSARVHGVDENNNLRVTLYNSAKQNLTEKILEAGIIRVDRKQCVAASNHQKQLVDTLIQAQNAAKKKRKCLWRYGDIESDEDL